MTTQRKLIAIAIAAAFTLPASGVLAQQSQTQQQQQHKQPGSSQALQPMAILASKMIGKDIVNARGEDLGEVRDLAIDMNHNRVHYAMLDMQGKMFAYPMRMLRWAADRDQVRLDVAEDRIERAPGMDRAAWQGMAGRPPGPDADAFWQEADAYWRQSPPKGAGMKVQPRDNMNLVWASKLIDWNVHDSASTNSIGEIEDLFIDPRDGSVRFVVVDFNDRIGAASDDRVYPLPLDAFATRNGKDDLVLKVDHNKLAAAHSLDEDRLADVVTDRALLDQATRYAKALTQSGKR